MADQEKDALAAYLDYHWETAPSGIVHADVPRIRKGDVLVELGRLSLVEYLATKDGEEAVWVHPFKGTLPRLCVHEPTNRLVLVGGTYRVTRAGIVG